MKKGFTLVELSIVLVIIGLLIGGILVGQSMIQTATIQGYVKKLEQYNIAINNFRLNYVYLPGDSPNFIPSGNGNYTYDYNSIGQNSGDCNQIDNNYHSYENYYVWAHLGESGMIKGEYKPKTCANALANVADKPGIDAPLFSQKGNSLAYYSYDADRGPDFSSVITPTEALAVDTKMDNGNNNTGQFQGYFDDNYDCQTYVSDGNDPNQPVCKIHWNPEKPFIDGYN